MSCCRRRLPGIVGALPAVALAVAVAAACSGGGRVDLPEVEPGTVSCEALRVFESYRYHSIVTFDLEDRGADMDPEGDPHNQEGFTLVWDIEAAFHEPDDVTAEVSYPESGDDSLGIVAVDGVVYQEIGGQWRETGGQRPFLYEPLPLCQSLAPDLNLDSLSGVSESGGEIPSTKYTLVDFPSEFARRSIYFGPDSDFGRLIEAFDVEVWVADEGGYITRMDVQGTGMYENGRQMHLHVFNEVRDINAGDISVEPPVG